MDTNSDVDLICKEMQEKAMKATKSSFGIKSSDFDYNKSFDKFNKMVNHQNIQSLVMLSSLIQNENKSKNISKLVSDDDKYDLISEINDNLLDKIGNYLDEASGLKKKDADLVLATIQSRDIEKMSSIQTSSWNRNIIRAKRVGNNCNLLSAKGVQRSQLLFKDKIDNSNHPFVPIIKEKPNAIKQLSIIVEKNELGLDSYSHPYEVEIEKFEPNSDFLDIEIPEMPKPVTETDFKYISNKEDLIQSVEELKRFKVISVDLEHHSYRTFQGFTCLMQISTKTCDYILDAIELRSDMHLLNEVFTSPSILKVFHGADSDIVWMQRDFGLYVVNLFDTYQASKLLSLPHLSLSYLLKHYCNIEPNKHFQLADWRIRPLTPEMMRYAREDTHYLHFIYIQMKNQLIATGNTEKNLLRAVFERSKSVCLKKYEKPLYNTESYRSLLKKSRVTFNAKQLYALKELYAWRDRIARNDDESIGYVLPNHMLMHIAEVLPREQQGILASCNPIPPLVKQQLNEIHLIILKARDKPLLTSDESARNELNISRLANRIIDLDELLHCRHDRYPLDSDINPHTVIEEPYDYNQIQQKLNLLDTSSPFIQFFCPQNALNSTKRIENICSAFISQYERYNLTIDRKVKTESETQESLPTNKRESNDNMNRVYSHFVNLTAGLDSKNHSFSETSSANTSNAITKEEQISDDSDIECLTNEPKSSNNIELKSDSNKVDAKDVKPFAYEEYDYSTTFSANNNRNSEPKAKGRTPNRKKNFKRKPDSKSFTYNPNKRNKY